MQSNLSRWIFLAALAICGFQTAEACNRPTRIMMLGDSITEGMYGAGEPQADLREGFRAPLYHLLVNDGFNFDFVGSRSNGQLVSPEFDIDHEGHAGYTSANLGRDVFVWLQNHQPDVILLHIGTNDSSTATAGLEQVLDEIDRYDADVPVILARIINNQSYSATIGSYNNNLVAMVESRIAAEDNIEIVDMEGALDYAVDMADNFHPNAAGYSKMAQGWYSALNSLLTDRCSGPPSIESSPITLAGHGEEYSYSIDVIGQSPISFSLAMAPPQMSIDSTGTVSWLPESSGEVSVEVVATNSLGSARQLYDLRVVHQAILDNGDVGTSAVGSWSVSGGPDPYGTESLYSKSSSATYSFELSLAGVQEVSLWWTEYANRSASVPVEIYDGSTLLDTVTVDQRVDGGQWNVLGQYSFSGLARIVIRSTGSGTTAADAVRLVPQDTTIPVITSQPVTEVLIGEDYSYRVEAVGDPSLSYSLLDVPVDMWVEPWTGVISWTPMTAGSYPVTVQVSNGNGSDTQSFTVDVVDPSSLQIIDNGDAGTTAVGSWSVSGGAVPYGTESLYSKSSGATYSFEASLAGVQEVSLWWTEYANRSASVPVEIYDVGTLLDTVTVDQRTDGGQWNVLGQYSFSGMARIVIHSTGSGTTAADAVRLMPQDTTIPVITSQPVTEVLIGEDYSYRVEALGDPSLSYSLLDGPVDMWVEPSTGAISWTPMTAGSYPVTVQVSNGNGSDTQSFTVDVVDPSSLQIIDNGDVGTSAVGTWDVSGGPDPYGTESLYSKSSGATYSFEASLAGVQEVSLWWTEYANRSASVPVEIYDGGTLLDTVTVDQRIDGGQWNVLGQYGFSVMARIVIRSTGSGTTAADAVRFVPQ